MIRKALLALIAGLLQAGVVLANAGPPPSPLPTGHRVADPSVRFEGTDRHKDRVFCLVSAVAITGTTVTEVKGEEPIKLDFKLTDRKPQVYLFLVAVERAEFERRKKEDPTHAWLKPLEPPAGVLKVRLTAPETTVPATVKEIPVTTYRVAIKDGKLTAERADEKPADPKGPSGMLPMLGFGLAVSLSLAWLGLWFARRGTPAGATATTSET
jgi:hypothetical protein